MTTVFEVMAELREWHDTNRDAGGAFERMIRQFLLTDPLYAERFTDVWMWSDWPGRNGKPDTGIDLVAELADGGLCAVQAKFYEPNHYLAKADIDSFLAASGKLGFTERLVVSTTDKWSSNAEETLEGQQVPVARIGVSDLADSAIDWSAFRLDTGTGLAISAKKTPRPHQQAAIDGVFNGWETSDRGKLIMACGTGKTFTALKIAERIATSKPEGDNTQVLFLVPSIALVNQTLREWTIEAAVSMRSFAVCSDTKVGKRSADEDMRAHDLAFPATTDPAKLIAQVAAADEAVTMTVIFSTYQSIDTVAQAQQAGLADFDLIVCDEAHRTTGVTLEGNDESSFVKVHDPDFLRASRRLYMTATPRLFDENTKAKAAEADALLCSMDDETLYGPEFHRLGFGKAVEAGLLTDYKVLVLNVDEGHIARSFQSQLADENNELRLEDAAKIVGCWNGLAKRPATLIAGDGFGGDTAPMKRAVAFSRSIKDSKALAEKFGYLIEGYTENHPDALRCEVSHVDGTYNSLRRKNELDWLKAEPPEGTCRILSNARCLSEGVDVPNLDAVLFLNPRNSVVDVVQSVGRVMRRSPGKQYGYIILPVGIPAGMDPAEALRDNKRYKIVWQVLQALRAHDDRFNAMVNQIELNKRDPTKIDVIGIGGGPGDDPFGDSNGKETKPTQGMLDFPIEDWRDAIFARIVLKVGERAYWEQWADDIKQIAERHVARIQAAVAEPGSPKAEAFERFVEELRANLNPGITSTDAIDMLAQHLITRPVFDALFGSYEFSEHNPVSLSMQAMLDELDDQALGKEAETLESFYAGVRARAEGIDNHDGRQTVITELYERFFKKALPKTADAFGIVYTPIPVVDFILRATNDALKGHFGTDLSAEGVQILDPFTGTGTFIVRLLQSGLIRPEDLLRKYTSELHANEILLLAYYIAAINIEAAFHQQHDDGYTPFEGIVLTDTFQMAEDTATLDAKLFPENNQRVARQKAQDIRVIIGNPPYSVGQTSENDGNKNQTYPTLDRRIEKSYVARSHAGLNRSMYDSYVRAIRWASDRIGDEGIVCFVSNGGWIDANSADGLRLALAEEFSDIYVYNLRGNQRTGGEESKREGGKIFGAGSRNTVAITLLLRSKAHSGPATIRYHDIGDYLTREEKLALIVDANLDTLDWLTITPNDAGDWTHQRSDDFSAFIPVGHKPRGGAAAETAIFDLFSLGVVTNRDSWCWGADRHQVGSNISQMAERVNQQIADFQGHASGLTGTTRRKAVEDFIDLDKTRVSWTANLKDRVARDQPVTFDPDHLVVGSYRPFNCQILYFDRALNERVYQQPRIYPSAEAANLGFTLTGPSSHYEFGVLATTSVPDLHLLDTGQYFPRYRYTDPDDGAGSLFEASGPERVDNINPDTLAAFSKALGRDVSADDVFFYTYGLLHSPDYRSRYRADLKRQLPRIPIVTAFDQFADAGRDLVDLHIGYETVEPYPLGDPSLDTLIEDPSRLRVEKMAYGKKGKDKDRTTIVYNRHITLTGIPMEAHRYLLGPKSAVEWVMERYQVKTDKASGIVNDPNAWCDEVGDPRYIIDLVKRVVTVSVKTMAIVDELPSLDIIS